MVFDKRNVLFTLLLSLMIQSAIISLYAEDTLILNDGRTLRGSILAIDSEIILFYDAEADNQRRIPKASVVGGRFGNVPLINADSVPENKAPNNRPPLIHLPFDKSFENMGSEPVEIASNGTIPFSDDPRNQPQKSVLSTGSGSYVRIKTTSALNTLKEFSTSFWFRSLDTHRPQYLVSKWKAAYVDSQTADGIFTIGYTNPGGRLFIFLVDQNGSYRPYPIDNAIPDNLSWNHIVVSFGNQQLNIYVNGNLASSNEIQYELYQENTSDILLMTAIYRDKNNDTGKIQEDFSTFNLIGQMDDFFLWDRALKEDEVQNLYRNNYSAPTLKQ